MNQDKSIKIFGQTGMCGGLKVFLGFAEASCLYHLSFADTLDEDTGLGYQRPRNILHSKRFKEYFKQENSSTIPLTFNLRPEHQNDWTLTEYKNYALLSINSQSCPLAQVDCQHRLGELFDCDLSIAFMTYIGLDLRKEMALFNVINSNAKGLSRSLTDFIDSNIVENLIEESPHLYIAKTLNEDPTSPWFKMVRYRGESTSGMKRKVSLRMLQISIKNFLRLTLAATNHDTYENYNLVKNYWIALKQLFPKEWDDSRHHMLTKGIGLYSLMYLLSDMVNTGLINKNTTVDRMMAQLSPLKQSVDWKSTGELANYGGHKGAVLVYEKFKKAMIL